MLGAVRDAVDAVHDQLWRRAETARSPSILQMEATECGAASLAMVLAWHGRWVPLEELRAQCGVSRDGTKASNILKAARHYGLAARGFRKEPLELTELPLPSIIHWNFNHFLVFEGFDGQGMALLNDPAYGRRRVDQEEFSESFTGVVLAFEPDSDFLPAGHAPSVLAILRGRLTHSRAGLAAAAWLALLGILPGIVAAGFGKIFVDRILIGGQSGWLLPLLIGMAMTAALRAILQWLQAERLLRLELKLVAVLGSEFVWHLLHLPLGFFQQRHAGDLAERVSANDEMAQLLSGKLVGLGLALVVATAYLLAMLAISWRLTLAVVPITLLNLAAVALAARRRLEVARRTAKENGQLMAATLGLVRSLETVKAAGLEDSAYERWLGYHAKSLRAHQELDRAIAILAAWPSLFASLGAVAALGLGAWQIERGAMSAGDLVAFLALAASFADPISRLVALAGSVQEAKASLNRISDVLGHAPDPLMRQATGARAPASAGAVDGTSATDSGRRAVARFAGALEMRQVSFGYNPQDEPLIEDVSLVVAPGRRVAIVGASGSGKSTLARLACGLYQPWSGEVLIDGRPLATLDRAVLANSVAYVDQDVYLFAGSVRDNLAMWDDAVEDTAINEALADAAIQEEVAQRPGRHLARVEEGGSNFSGGQRQRLEIARALTGRPSLLILDEAMAALDPLVEADIDDNLRRRGCTCLIIAHRLSTVRDCDEILMLESGRVIARGRHEELLKSCAPYAELVHAQ